VIDIRQETLKALRASPVVVRALVAGLTAEEAHERPEPGEWAVVEVVAHMADTDEWALARVRRMLGERDPDLPSFDQDAVAVERRYLDMDVTDVVERYAAGRADHLSVLENLDDAGWHRTGRHEEQRPDHRRALRGPCRERGRRPPRADRPHPVRYPPGGDRMTVAAVEHRWSGASGHIHTTCSSCTVKWYTTKIVDSPE
jgi:hypothetical protein